MLCLFRVLLSLAAFILSTQASSSIPGRFIVELENPSRLEKKSSSGDVASDFVKSLNKGGISASPIHRFTSKELFYGLSFVVSDPINDLDEFLTYLNLLPDVKQAWTSREVHLKDSKTSTETIKGKLKTKFESIHNPTTSGPNGQLTHFGDDASGSTSQVSKERLKKHMGIQEHSKNDNIIGSPNQYNSESFDFNKDPKTRPGDMRNNSTQEDVIEDTDYCYVSSDSCSIYNDVFKNFNRDEQDTPSETRINPNEFGYGAPQNFTYPRWNPHALTGVQQLHERGYTGSGVIIGVIDSGAYYYDNALGGGFGEDYKIAYGWNFVGNVYNQEFQTGYFEENNDILDCYGHGSHVTGIIAASNDSHLVGVAPEATIYAYKVFGCVGVTSDDTIINAMIDAFNNGCDIISMSLGVDGVAYEENPMAILASRITKLGVFVAASAANAGTVGPFYGNSVASGRHVTSVGAASTGQYLAYEGNVTSTSGNWHTFAYTPASGVQPGIVGTFSLLVFQDTACNLEGQIPPNSNNEPIALLFPSMPSCKPNQFYITVAKLGYKVVLHYTNEDNFNLAQGYPSPDRGMYDPIIVRGAVTSGFGSWVTNEVNRGNNVSIILDEESTIPRSVIIQDSVSELQMGLYSSWGPDYSGNLYPHVTAPGSNIFSTYLNKTFAVMSGTSMAAPYIAGVAALYIQAKRESFSNINIAEEIDRKMMQTASPIAFNTDIFSEQKYTTPLILQGFGMVNATSLLDTQTEIISTPILSMGISTNLKLSFEVVLYNGNEYPVTYQMIHQPAVTIFSKRPDQKIFPYLPPFTHQFVKINAQHEKQIIPANSSFTFNVSMVLPESVNADYGPIYQGKLLFSGDNGDQVSAAYTGTYVDRYLTWEGLQQPFLVHNAITDAALALDDQNITINNGQDAFLYVPYLVGATEVFSAVVSDSFNLDNLTFGFLEASPGIVEPINQFPLTLQPRSSNGAFYVFQLLDSAIPDGIYRLFTAVLPAVPTFIPNETTLANWQTYISAPFNLIVNPAPLGIPPPNLSSQLNSSIFTDVEISSLNANSSLQIYPYDSILVTVNIQSELGLPFGSTANISLPYQFINFPEPFPVYNDVGIEVLNVSIDPETNVLTATVVEDWPVIYVAGSIIFSCFLRDPSQYTESQSVPITFRKLDVGEGSVLMMYIELADTSFPSIKSTLTGSDGMINVYIPSSFGNWSNLDVEITSDYPLGCNNIAIDENALGSLVYGQGWNEAQFSPINSQTSIKCSGNLATMTLSEPPPYTPDIRISIPVFPNNNVVSNSPISSVIRGNFSGALFNYYMSDVLNNISLRSNSLALTGKRTWQNEN